MPLPPFFRIDDCLISVDIIDEFFACDYSVCKGACCIKGDSGAPLAPGEDLLLQQRYPSYSSLMGEGGRRSVEKNGFSVVDRDGDTVTPLVEGSEECAFCHFRSDGSCMCAPEMATREGEFVKPVSCALYPIRVSHLGGGLDAMNLHRWDICRCAFEKGRREGIRVFRFLRPVIESVYGEEFYACMEKFCAEFVEK